MAVFVSVKFLKNSIGDDNKNRKFPRNKHPLC